ncbi:MAG: hypothetical protein ABW134_11775 [Candidatus Thiodiazotropha endolucinida]
MTESKIKPIPPINVQLAQHAYRMFNVAVPGKISKKDITNPVLFEHVAKQLTLFSELRVIADDGSFMARLLVMYVSGTDVIARVIEYHEFEELDYSRDNVGEYFTHLRGPKRWCIVKRSDGSVVKENMPDKATAERELGEYLKALAA